MSNTTSPGTGYDFLPHYRQAIRLMREGQLTPAHYDHLVPLAWLLVDEIKKQIDKRPKATKGRLIESLRECLNEGPHAETVFRHTVKALENIPAEHDALYPLLRDTVGVIDDVLGGLLELLCTRYEGQLDGHIATHKKLVPVRELVKQYLPGFHPLNRQSVIAPQPLDTPAAFWKALRRMPMEVEWVNDSPCYTVPVYLLGYEDFNEDLRPLREAFEAALPKLKTKHLRLLHHDLSELLGIDRQSFRRLEALYNERKYALQFLPDDYPILRFEVAAPGRGLASPWQWVNPSIWTGFVVLMQYKQEVARTIYDKISAALDKLPYPFPTTAPATTEPPQPGSPALETPAAAVAAYPWAEIEALALQIELRKDGRFTPAGNRIAAAVAGLIDALLDNNIISDTVTRPIHYANFSEHYGQPIGADRVKPTRTHWHQKARKELGLPNLKPPKLRV